MIVRQYNVQKSHTSTDTNMQHNTTQPQLQIQPGSQGATVPAFTNNDEYTSTTPRPIGLTCPSDQTALAGAVTNMARWPVTQPASQWL